MRLEVGLIPDSVLSGGKRVWFLYVNGHEYPGVVLTTKSKYQCFSCCAINCGGIDNVSALLKVKCRESDY